MKTEFDTMESLKYWETGTWSYLSPVRIPETLDDVLASRNSLNVTLIPSPSGERYP